MIKVKQFYNKNQFIIEMKNKEKENIFILQSYESIIAKYNENTTQITLFENWNYSKTTLKHLYLFFNDYIVNYDIDNLNTIPNKKKYIQQLIDNNIIQYNNSDYVLENEL